MRTQKLYVILKKIINKRITYTQTATKPISLFNASERLKSPPPLLSLNSTGYPMTMFLISGLKFELKSILENSFNLMQKKKIIIIW